MPARGALRRIKKNHGMNFTAAVERGVTLLETKLAGSAAPARNNGTAWKTPRAQLPTLPQLRAERQKVRGGK